MDWTACPQGGELFINCEVDFLLPNIEGEEPLKMSKGDKIIIDWPNGNGDSAFIEHIDENSMRLQLGDKVYSLRPATDADNLHSIKADGMDIHPWIVIE